ncbi:MAG TPA: MBL fold metallo-hydrolase [Candidatus Acidoferrum sp.]|nr:MBL fold metallo-hydrolase [Candidatus Acidoferrum sp.]
MSGQAKIPLQSPAFPARRHLLKQTLALLAAGALPAVLPLEAWAQPPQGAGPTSGPAPALPAEPGAHIVLLGTRGGPGIDLNRSQTAVAVVVDGVPYLVDCGYGTVRQLVASGVGFQRIDNIFLTHLHDDHTADLAALLNFQWTNGNKAKPTDVYGPYGTAKMVDAITAFATPNAEIRTVDEGRKQRIDTQFHGHDVNISPTKVAIYKDERVTVTGIQNAHYPDHSMARMQHRSMAIRFDTKYRSIVFSGDTSYSSSIVELAKGADYFLCEIMDETSHAQNVARAKAATEAGNPDNIYRHLAETHAPPSEVARMATEAKVGTVVLYHLLPGAAKGGLAYPTSTFIDDVHKGGFSGEVIVGQDLMVL